MNLTDSRTPSGAQETDFFFFPSFERPGGICGGVAALTGGGVETDGESLRALPSDFNTSWNGSIDDGWAILSSDSFFTATGAGAFLKLGSFGLGLGAEKNEESDLASLTAGATAVFAASFFFGTGFVEEDVPRAGFFVGTGTLGGTSTSLRFLDLASEKRERRVA